MNRAEKKEQRRVALLEGALAVLTAHGLEGFTTGRIAAEAGIAQSGFYKYWPDRDAALRAVAEHLGEQALRSIREARLAAGGRIDQLSNSFAGGLEAMLQHHRTVTLFLRFRREPGPLGDVFRGLVERAHQELETDMVRMGLVPAGDPWAGRLAFYVVTLCIGAVEGLVDGRLDDVQRVADDLGRIAASVLGAR